MEHGSAGHRQQGRQPQEPADLEVGRAPISTKDRQGSPEAGARSAYRGRHRVENARTAAIVVEIAQHLDPTGGYVLVNDFETRRLLAHTPMDGKRVLEVGCGTLPVTLALPASMRPRLFVATDVDWQILSVARTLDSRPQYVVQSALDPAIRPRSQDVVILNQVLHHLPPDANLLGELRTLLAPGGRIVMMEPNVSCGPAELIKSVLKRFFGMSMEASPYGQFSRRTIAGLIEQSGLAVEREWFASVLAFPLTGGQGRVKVVPDWRALFRFLIAVDEALSRLTHFFPPLARFLHWRVIYLLIDPGAPRPPG